MLSIIINIFILLIVIGIVYPEIYEECDEEDCNGIELNELEQDGYKALDKIMHSSKTLSYNEYLDVIDKMDKSILQKKIKEEMICEYLSFNEIDRVIAKLRQEREQDRIDCKQCMREKEEFNREEKRLKDGINKLK